MSHFRLRLSVTRTCGQTPRGTRITAHRRCRGNNARRDLGSFLSFFFLSLIDVSVKSPTIPTMPETEKKEEQPTEEKTEEEKTKETSTATAAVDGAEAEAEARVRARKENNELTKRLQKLALERQKESKGERLKVIQSDTSSHLSSAKSFQELSLPKPLLDGIFAMGFDRPSAIQEEALPRILAEPPRNLIGQAQSGSGKTAAFTLGMLYRIKTDDPPTCQALCVTPTRELAIQIVNKAVKPMAQNMTGLKVQLAIAGVNAERGKKVDAHLVVGTPGKVVDWIKRKYIDTRNIRVMVLDEADNVSGLKVPYCEFANPP